MLTFNSGYGINFFFFLDERKNHQDGKMKIAMTTGKKTVIKETVLVEIIVIQEGPAIEEADLIHHLRIPQETAREVHRINENFEA